MVRLLGAAVLAAIAAWAGLVARRRLFDRVAMLRALSAALARLERELSFHLAPLPRLFEALAVQAGAPVSGFFAHCAQGMGNLGTVPLSALWESGLDSNLATLTQEERQTMHELGAVLGRYDGERQRQALREAAERLDEHITAAVEQRDRLGRVYSALGITGGLFLLILIL